MTYDEALVAIAGKDPAMATVLMHNHECIEKTKAEGIQRGVDVVLLTAAVKRIESDIRSLLLTIAATMVSAIGFLVWQVLTHPHGFAQ